MIGQLSKELPLPALAQSCVVMIKEAQGSKYWAVRVCFFLSHTPPGIDLGEGSGVFIADVK